MLSHSVEEDSKLEIWASGVGLEDLVVRGRAPETQVSADRCGHSIQRWLGTISIDTKIMMTPRSGVSVDDDEVDGVGDKVGNDKAGGVGGNSVASTRVSSVLTNAWSDPWTAVDYRLRFYLYPDR
ncbi:uncharacterized protein UHOD_11911 [Ustilago sp. UG-2017b]|nr:uncharacterized protein UHOD_11911 [Ustilago sp. UG-2017b]